MKPLAIDLFCGLGGWTDGLLIEGYKVIGFDIERHDYGDGARYPAQLVMQDVMTIDGAQFRDAALIVASPPCQEYSYMAMPWSKAKAKRQDYLEGRRDRSTLTALFDACFRIQREACAAAGRYIPMVVENVRGAQEWVGRSRWNFGSFHLWGDVPALMPMTAKAVKVPGFRCDGSGRSFQSAAVDETGFKSQGLNWSDRSRTGQDFTRVAGLQAEGRKGVPHACVGHWTNPAENGLTDVGRKVGGDWFSDPLSPIRTSGSKSKARKAASAAIAKIPLILSRHIAKTYYPCP